MDTELLDNKTIGGHIRAVRTARKLDLRDVSNRLEPLGLQLGVSALSKMERGARKITAEELYAIALVLDVPPDRLLGGGNLSAARDVLAQHKEASRRLYAAAEDLQQASADAKTLYDHVGDIGDLNLGRLLFAATNDLPKLLNDMLEQHGEDATP